MRILWAFFLGIIFSGSVQGAEVYSASHELMHTRWDINVVSDSTAHAQKAIRAATAAIERMDKELAMWRPDSELAAINKSAGKGPQKISPDLAKVLGVALRVAKLSQGAFDVTVGPLVKAWHAALEQGKVLSASQIKELKKSVDWRKIKFDSVANTVDLPAGMVLDLGGIAKGYAQDIVAATLEAQGIHAYLLNAGGQVYARGRKPNGQRWVVGIAHPRSASERLAARLELEDQCLSTSGDYEQFHLIKKRRYHHILDPLSGAPTRNGMASASVIVSLDSTPGALSAALADGLSTACFVLGEKKARRLITKLKIQSVFLIETSPGKIQGRLSQNLVGHVDLALEDPR